MGEDRCEAKRAGRSIGARPAQLVIPEVNEGLLVGNRVDDRTGERGLPHFSTARYASGIICTEGTVMTRSQAFKLKLFPAMKSRLCFCVMTMQ